MTDQPNPNTAGNSGNSDNAGGNDQKNVRTFTQSELDALFTERARRAAEGATTDILTKAGVKSVDELTTALAEGKKLKESQLTELEKVKADLQAANEKLSQAETERQKALATANERLLKAAVLAEASAQNFRPEAVNDVWLIIDRAKIKENNGEFEGVKEAVAEVVKAKPFWLKQEDQKNKGTPKPGEKKTTGSNDNPPPKPSIRF